MLIDLRDHARRPLGRVVVDPATRPTRVTLAGHDREHFLNWDGALDDAGHLRRCTSCGCAAMFKSKSFPQLTLFVVVLAFAGAVVSALGYAADPKVLSLLVLVLLIDVAILLFSRERLVCYRCRSTYSQLEIARYHRRWDRREAERHPAQPLEQPATPPGGAAGETGAAREGVEVVDRQSAVSTALGRAS